MKKFDELFGSLEDDGADNNPESYNFDDDVFDSYDGSDESDNIIVLNDESGNEVPFEFLDLIEYQGDEYVVLLPADDEIAAEVVILKLEETDNEDEESYSSVDDENILNAVFAIFKEKFKDEFNFVD